MSIVVRTMSAPEGLQSEVHMSRPQLSKLESMPIEMFSAEMDANGDAFVPPEKPFRRQSLTGRRRVSVSFISKSAPDILSPRSAALAGKKEFDFDKMRHLRANRLQQGQLLITL